MKKIREGLFGNFVSLHDVLRSVAARIKVGVGQVDGFRSPNRDKGRADKRTTEERARIRAALAHASAAGELFRLLNSPAGRRPNWYDSSPGFPLLDDSLGREGLDILVQAMKSVLPPATRPVGKWCSGEPWVPGLTAKIPRAMQLGFDVDELIPFLDANRVSHGFGKPINFAPSEGDVAPLPADDRRSKAGPNVSEPDHAHRAAHQSGSLIHRLSDEHPTTDAQEASPGHAKGSRKFNGPLSVVLGRAWDAAPKKTRREVFNALCDLARQKPKPMAPLVRYEKEVVIWKMSETDKEQEFTIKSMKSRMREPDEQ